MQLFEGEEPEFDELSLNFTIDELREALIGGYGEEAAKLQWGTPDAEMVRHLSRNVYQFSVAKNFTQMRTLTSALIDENGHTRSFSDFMTEASKIDKKFNVDYLRAEYDTAINSAEMASHWVRFKQMGNPMLRYVTVGDERVRESHAAMNGIQRPMSDPIWDKIYPPNGWNCRCTVIATSGAATPDKQIRMPWDVPPLFQTNLAKTGMLWPKGHPYFKATDEIIIKQEGNDRFVDNAIEAATSKKEKLQAAGYAIRDVILDEFGKNATIKIPKQKDGIPSMIKLTSDAVYSTVIVNKHSKTVNCKRAALNALRNPDTLIHEKTEELGERKNLDDEKDRKNIDKKKRKGVKYYQLFSFEYNNKQYILGCQDIEKKNKHYLEPYYVTQKK